MKNSGQALLSHRPWSQRRPDSASCDTMALPHSQLALGIWFCYGISCGTAVTLTPFSL